MIRTAGSRLKRLTSRAEDSVRAHVGIGRAPEFEPDSWGA